MRRGHIGLIAIVSEWAGALTTASMHFRLEQAAEQSRRAITKVPFRLYREESSKL